MPRLYVLTGRDAGRSFAVQDGALLGRATSCAVRLVDLSVSRVHARLERRGASWHLVDQGSRNGLSQAGVRLASVELVDRAEVTLGELVLRFREEGFEIDRAPTGVQPEPFERAGELVLEEEIELLPGDAGMPAAEPSAPMAGAKSPLRAAPSERDLLRSRLLQQGPRAGGLLGRDLAQEALWIRALVVLLAVGLFALLAWFAFRGVELLRRTG
jgi:hypothetical protein